MQSQEVLGPLENGLTITRLQNGRRLTLTLALKTASECILHWGLRRRPEAAWRQPPQACWPEGTVPADSHAARTRFWTNGPGERKLALQLELPCPARHLAFVLYFPKENRWLKCGNKDFMLELPHDADNLPTPAEALARWVPGTETRRQEFTLDNGEQLATAVQTGEETIRVVVACDAASPLALHWGLTCRFRHEWCLPPENQRPAGTVVFDRQAVQTPFQEREGLRWLEMEFRKPTDGPTPRSLKFVVYQPDGAAWLKSAGKDMTVPLFEAPPDPRLPAPRLRDLAEQIVGAEMGAESWTLMHRFQLCHELLEKAGGDEDALALLFAWLRYSATRHLDWQRRYNTKPRELSHAQDRLSARLAGVGRQSPAARSWARRLLTTMGRGGEGQRVRDEILHIMHRNHIKETSGHFIEEWHQKLHNNTTPDDVAICAGYLAFLRGNGDTGAFYRVLEEAGVSRQRLRGFERPIRNDPEFYPDRKNALLGEFENFLRILKSVHSGTDLESAYQAARGRIGKNLPAKIDGLLGLRQRNAGVEEQVGAVLAAREELAGLLDKTADDAGLRDLLYLDLALEETLRALIERQELGRFDRDRLVGLVRAALQNLMLSTGAEELRLCLRHWSALLGQPRDGREWALHAKSVADRMGRWLQQSTDELYRCLQPKAEYLGAAFEVAAWAVPLFSEEVIRGGPAFPLSLLLRRLDPVLRQAAGLGGWQIVSPAAASGRIRVVECLHAVQHEHFAEPTLLIADRVGGDEEVPVGVTAVLTRDTPDLVSHLAVRARNARVLLATCWDETVYATLKGQNGKRLGLRVRPDGDVIVEEAATDAQTVPAERPVTATRKPRTIPASLQAIAAEHFTPDVVGGKSNNLNGLRGRLPDWIRLPTSIALPFGACEQTLASPANAEIRQRHQALLAALPHDPPAVLAGLRSLFLELAAPDGLRRSVETVWQQAALPPVSWDQTWNGIRRVWASKWNERAYLSRQARNVPHEDLWMAVLMQQVVPADYAFVLHTVNPLTGNRDELFGEVVLGLGETLVGNYPGRALGFTCRKADLAIEVVSYPGKSEGLYGSGAIFRSDSNGEDLEGFAGAGLYDSFLAEEPRRRTLDYSGERLLWDRGFRDGMLRAIARAGIEVERLLASPQDIEGAVAGEQYFIVQTRPQVGLDQP